MKALRCQDKVPGKEEYQLPAPKGEGQKMHATLPASGWNGTSMNNGSSHCIVARSSLGWPEAQRHNRSRNNETVFRAMDLKEIAGRKCRRD